MAEKEKNQMDNLDINQEEIIIEDINQVHLDKDISQRTMVLGTIIQYHHPEEHRYKKNS